MASPSEAEVAFSERLHDHAFAHSSPGLRGVAPLGLHGAVGCRSVGWLSRPSNLFQLFFADCSFQKN